MHEEHLAAAFELGPDGARDDVGVEPHDLRLNGEPIARRRLDDRHVADTDERHVQRPRDGRGRHRENVHPFSQLLDAFLVRDAETLLLVHDEQSEVTERDVFRQQPVCANDDVHLAVGEQRHDLLLLLLRTKAADHFDPDREPGEPILERARVLEGQHGGRRQKRHLLTVHDRLERGAHGDFGLAVANVAAEQSIHRRRRFHVAPDVGDRGLLIGRELVLERVGKFLVPVRVGGEREARNRLARGVELQQFFGHVAHGLLHPGLGLLPGRAAQLVEGGRRPARVLLDEIEPFERNEQLVVAGVMELHELLHRVAGRDRQSLQSCEPADPVVHVHDQVANLQVPEIREERSRRRSPALVDAAFLLEQIRLGEDQQRPLRHVKAARELSGRDEHGGAREVVGRADRTRPDLVVGEKLDGALGAARAGRDEDHGVAAVSCRPNLVSPVPDAPVVLQRRHRRHVHGARAATVDLELTDVVRSAQPARQVLPACGDGFERDCRTAASDGLGCRRAPLLFEGHGALLDVLELERHDRDTRATGVVHDRGGSVERRRDLRGPRHRAAVRGAD